jgi:hypothetical protein
MIRTRFMILAGSVLALAPLMAQRIERGAESLTANIAPEKTSASLPAYTPITPEQRFHWVLQSTLGPANLMGNAFTSAWGTARNSPEEYGAHWQGFGKRYGLGLANAGVSHSIEAGMGSLWGEDPRYFRAGAGQPFGNRIGHVAKMTFMATDREGHAMPAYSRYIAVSGTSFLSNTWRPDSQAEVDAALKRIPLSFVAGFTGRAFAEFWPDLRGHIFRRKNP